MATSQKSIRTVSCQYVDCDERGQEWEFTDGQYCSTEHKHRALGANLLLAIERRHELCRTCFRIRKDIERPPAEYMRTHFQRSGVGWALDDEGRWTVERWGQETTRDAVCGYAYGTEHAAMGPYGLECQCGAIDSDIDEPAIRDIERWAEWLALATEYLAEIGARDDTLAAETVRYAFERTDGDLEYAVGLALDV